MADPYISEIRPFAFDFAPRGWAWCDGKVLSISQNSALFALLGTQFGGNGQTNFQLPDLRSRVPVGISGNYQSGMAVGVELVTLTAMEMPTHSHLINATTADGSNPALFSDRVFSTSVDQLEKGGDESVYTSATSLTQLAENTLLNTGGSQPHNNIQPSIAINFCIALVGIFPSHN